MIHGYYVLDFKILEKHGNFSRIRYWFHGHHTFPHQKHSTVRFIQGLTGPETELTVDTVMPVYNFIVKGERK